MDGSRFDCVAIANDDALLEKISPVLSDPVFQVPMGVLRGQAARYDLSWRGDWQKVGNHIPEFALL